MLIRRDDYMDLLYSGKNDNDVVKVITGVRRCGKSTLLEMYMMELRKSGVSGDCIFHLNLESSEGQKITDSQELNEWLSKIPTDRQTYLFLDEIQNVDKWELSVAAIGTMHMCDLYITGSNSKMLSSDLSTHISGRYVEIPMLPLSFSEYLKLHPSDDVDKSFDLFLRYGSLPGVDPSRGERYCMDYLEGVYNTVLVKDVLQRKELRSVRKLNDISRFLYSNIGNVTNDSIISKKVNVSPNTADSYIEGLTEALLFYHADTYDIVGKKLLETNGKYYATDLGMRNAALKGAEGTDISRPVENIVFLELIRRGYTVRIGSFRDSEVDFTAVRDGVTEYYQVTLTMVSPDTRNREFRSLKGIRDNWRKTILTLDRLGLGSDEGVDVVNLFDWLLGKV
ncbi:MAG: ATP-binding protein [Candidatus Methanomethylophilaceae archaeon]